MGMKYGIVFVLSTILVTLTQAQEQVSSSQLPTTGTQDEVGTADSYPPTKRPVDKPMTGGIWNFVSPPAETEGLPTDQTEPILLEDFLMFIESKTINDYGATDQSENQPNVVTEKGNQIEVNPDTLSPEEFGNWLNGIETPVKDNENSDKDAEDRFNPDVIPPEKFRNWLDSKTPATHKSESEPNEHIKRVEKADKFLSRNMIIVIATAGGTTVLCIVLITVVCCLKRNRLSEKEKALEDKNFNVKPLHGLAVVDKGSDLFMGIPANNDIWKDLQNLPKTSSGASLSESEKQ